MLVLFIYLLWSISYLIILFVFKVLFLDKLINKKSKLINFLLILFYNKNLSFYKNHLATIDLKNLENIRYSKYPVLSLIHDKINYIFFKNINKKVDFRGKYKIYRYLNNNKFNQNLNLTKNTSLINYSILQNIVYNFSKLTEFNNYKLIYYNIFKNSITNKEFLVEKRFIKLSNDLLKPLMSSVLVKTLINKKVINITNYLANIKLPSYNWLFVDADFILRLQNLFKISFSVSNIVKYLSEISISKSTILFLRKNKIFNKSRYSRNRQTYRTGAYWCLYVNIIAVIAFYFWFYNFTMNFGYIWWLLYTFILSFFLFKSIKFNFYNIKTLYSELLKSLQWFSIILSSLLKQLIKLLENLVLNTKLNFLISIFFKIKTSFKGVTRLTNILNKFNDFLYSRLN